MAERLDDKGVHDEARLHVGDTGPKGLVVFYPEGPLGSGAVGEDSVAMAHQHDGAVAANAGQPRGNAIAKCFMGDGLAGNARRFEIGSQPVADRIDAVVVVAARIDVHEVRQEGHHRLMLPAEMLENGGLCFAAHACPPGGSTPTFGIIGKDRIRLNISTGENDSD